MPHSDTPADPFDSYFETLDDAALLAEYELWFDACACNLAEVARAADRFLQAIITILRLRWVEIPQ